MKNRKTNSAIHYRRMTVDDLPAAHKLSLSVLWPHRLEDWKFVHELGEGIEGNGLILLCRSFEEA